MSPASATARSPEGSSENSLADGPRVSPAVSAAEALKKDVDSNTEKSNERKDNGSGKESGGGGALKFDKGDATRDTTRNEDGDFVS